MSRRCSLKFIGNRLLALSCALPIIALLSLPTANAQEKAPHPSYTLNDNTEFLDTYCSSCHNDYDFTADLSVWDLEGTDPHKGEQTELWEKVLRKVNTGEMPPVNRKQPSIKQRETFLSYLESSLDGYANSTINPGRATLRRLNRASYQNAVRDLLSLDIDIEDELPVDNSGYGFDNIADVLTVSPTLMERYLAVASKVAALATGTAADDPVMFSYQIPKDGSIKNSGRPAYNERASTELPLTSRGGGIFDFYATHGGMYEIRAHLNANTNNEVDREIEDRYSAKIALDAGPHKIGMAFRRNIGPDLSIEKLSNTTDIVVLPTDPPDLLDLDIFVDGKRVETLKVPSYRMSPRFSQKNFPRDVMQIDVLGPHKVTPQKDTPTRQAIFICEPETTEDEKLCADKIIKSLAYRAYRRPVDENDLAPLLNIYAAEREVMSFDHAIGATLEAILVSPSFIFLQETDPSDLPAGESRPLNDFELASRLSLFLWSSIPDKELLDAAGKGLLQNTKELESQITRMLADPKAKALTDNFAGQWLYLRNLEAHRPDINVFPDFDVRLREAMLQETEMFFEHVLTSNKSVMDFISSDYTFLNERLANHYDIDGVTGTAMRHVSLDKGAKRGGILGHGSVLTVTSYANHTSVVKRGHWILEHILASPTPPPPPDIPALIEKAEGKPLTMRAQLELHRASPSCSSCHMKIDPLGFALEEFDAVGRYRTTENKLPVDATATMPDGTEFTGLAGLQGILLSRKDEFAHAFTEQLMTYALARGLTGYDQPTVRQIVRDAAEDDYRIQTFIKLIIQSEPFLMKEKAES